jgi:hypothetical protein
VLAPIRVGNRREAIRIAAFGHVAVTHWGQDDTRPAPKSSCSSLRFGRAE